MKKLIALGLIFLPSLAWAVTLSIDKQANRINQLVCRMPGWETATNAEKKAYAEQILADVFDRRADEEWILYKEELARDTARTEIEAAKG